MNKSVIYIFASVGGVVGGWVGSLIDGSILGLWGIILGGVGGLIGIYIAYKIQS